MATLNVFVHVSYLIVIVNINISSFDDSHENPLKLVISILLPNKSSHSSTPNMIIKKWYFKKNMKNITLQVVKYELRNSKILAVCDVTNYTNI